MKKRRVVVTGFGAVTPLGLNASQTWSALLAGRSGVGPITLFDASSFPTKIAGEVKGALVEKWVRQNGHRQFKGRNSVFALEATEEAIAHSRIALSQVAPERAGIYFGAGDGGFDFASYASIMMGSVDETGLGVGSQAFIQNSLKMMNPLHVAEQEPAQVVRHLAEHFKVRGMVYNTLTACAASSQAIGEAQRWIREGYCDVMVTGGAHSMIHPLGVAGFNLLTALSTQNDTPQCASRPFDKSRDGFVLSEGAAVLILEELEHAKKRGAKIWAELAGYGGSADAFRLTDPHSEGRGAVQAMNLAMADAGLRADQIDYINAHGTSTQLNDQVESASVKKVFGQRAYQIPMSSIKSMLGHMIAAAGATELIASILTIQEGMIPPTINYQTPDQNCDLDYVPNVARKAKVNTVLSNSFGFGGQNVALVVQRFREDVSSSG